MDCKINDTPYRTHTFAFSSPQGKFSVCFTAIIANHCNSTFFLLHQVLIIVGQTEEAWNEKFAWHFYT